MSVPRHPLAAPAAPAAPSPLPRANQYPAQSLRDPAPPTGSSPHIHGSHSPGVTARPAPLGHAPALPADPRASEALQMPARPAPHSLPPVAKASGPDRPP